jgi:hypothetical protein
VSKPDAENLLSDAAEPSLGTDDERMGRVTLVEALQNRWESQHLLVAGRWSPTFIEDVGSAAAENVRSAAVRRWFQRHPTEALAWIGDTLNSAVASPRLRIQREVTLSRDSRIDLCIWDGDRHLAFIEMKWGSAPNDQQIMRYRSDIDAQAPGTPLIMVNPVRHVAGQDRPLPPNTYLTDWSQLLEHMKGAGEKGSIEEDLRVTIARWHDLRQAVRAAVRELRTTIDELRDLVAWLDADTTTVGAETSEYPRLSRRLIIAEIADAFVERPMSHRWRRCLGADGAHGDVQADVSPRDLGDLWFPCADCPDYGVALVLRFHAYPDFRSLDVMAGSMVMPYKEGKAKDLPNSSQRTALFQHATRMRIRLAEVVRNAGLASGGRPDTSEWWKRTHCSSFGDGRTVQDVHAQAEKVAGALIKVK